MADAREPRDLNESKNDSDESPGEIDLESHIQSIGKKRRKELEKLRRKNREQFGPLIPDPDSFEYPFFENITEIKEINDDQRLRIKDDKRESTNG